MSEARFPPSQRRLEEARARGEVAVSPLLVRAASGVAALTAMLGAATVAGASIVAFARVAWAAAPSPTADAAALVAAAERALASVIAPVLVALVGAAVAAGLLQSRGAFQPGAASSAASDEPPVRTAGLGALVVAGAAIACAFAWRACGGGDGLTAHLTASSAADGARLLVYGARLAGHLSLAVAAASAVAGAADLLLRQLALRRSLWMTREEVEAERREEQGDPTMRRERRRAHRALLASDATSRESIDRALAAATLLAVDGDRAAAVRHEGGATLLLLVLSGRHAARLLADGRARAVPIRSAPLAAIATLPVGGPLPDELARLVPRP